MATACCSCGAAGGCGPAFDVGEGGEGEGFIDSKCAYAVRDFFATTSGLPRTFRTRYVGVVMLYVEERRCLEVESWGWKGCTYKVMVVKENLLGCEEVVRSFLHAGTRTTLMMS